MSRRSLSVVIVMLAFCAILTAQDKPTPQPNGRTRVYHKTFDIKPLGK